MSAAHFIGALVVACLAGCGGPSLVIRNFDPGAEKAEIWVDGQRVGALGYDEDVSVSVAPGRHTIKAIAPGATESRWHPGAPFCEIVIEDDAVMTLVPPGAR